VDYYNGIFSNYWIIITGFLAIMTGLIYGAVNLYVDSPIMIFGVIPFELKDAVLVFSMALVVLISASYLYPKNKKSE